MQNDLISRSALLKEFENRQEQQTNKYCDCFLNDAQELSTEWWCVEDAVIAAPTIDAVEVVHGRWILERIYRKCSLCEWIFCIRDEEGDLQKFNYCPNCGMPMDGGADK